jgi:DNA (cytosine-5)-methyltransferase 1
MGGGLNGQDLLSGRIIPVPPVPYDLLQVTHPLNAQNRSPGDPCHCLAKDNASSAAIVEQDPWRVRRLTPVECERLMGFPDGYTEIPRGKKGKPASHGPRYRALGNSIAINALRWVGKRISLVDSL